MNIDEAIETQIVLHKLSQNLLTPKELEAQRLSIEALKEVKDCRLCSVGLIKSLLPGETKD